MGHGIQPDLLINDLQELSFDFLKRQGIKGIIIDLDNTILPWIGKDIPETTLQWLAGLKHMGVKFCILSNSSSRRVYRFAHRLDIPAVSKAIKPRRKAFTKALRLLGTDDYNTAVVGDQLFTDVWGGNRLKLYTVLVTPMHKREFVGTMLVRQVEKWVLRRKGW